MSDARATCQTVGSIGRDHAEEVTDRVEQREDGMACSGVRRTSRRLKIGFLTRLSEPDRTPRHRDEWNLALDKRRMDAGFEGLPSGPPHR